MQYTCDADGLRWDEDGELRYYRNGYLTRAGLIYVDGHYYYIKSDGTAVRNQEYWISHNNGLLPNQDYIFNEYGWLTNPESDKEIEVQMSTNNAVSSDMYFDWTLNPGTATSVTYTYTYNGGTLAQMTGGGNTLSFAYDASGKPMAVIWGTTTYLYLTNLQGDVIAILDTAGNQVVQYTYDAWGKILTTTGTLADTLGALNPITYRGYVYDIETDLYYLQSRYYNPTIGRFVNADALVSTGQGLLGNNMFAYCNNNPANAVDPTGHAALFSVAIFDDPTKGMFLGCGGAGGGRGYALAGAAESRKVIKKIKDVVTNASEAVVEQNLKKNGVAFYNGALVCSTDLLTGTSAFSFGIIVLESENIDHNDFEKTLNHEYGHMVHSRQIGLVDYFFSTAIPSLAGAALSYDNVWIGDNYYSLPWERVAEHFGRVNRGYLPWANSAGSIFWIGTVIVSSMTPW